MSRVEYLTIFRYFLLISLFAIDEVCPGEHLVHGKEFLTFRYINDFVRDVLFNIFRWMEIYVKKGHAGMTFNIKFKGSYIAKLCLLGP